MAATDMEAEIFGEKQKDDLPEEFKSMSAEDVQRRCALAPPPARSARLFTSSLPLPPFSPSPASPSLPRNP